MAPRFAPVDAPDDMEQPLPTSRDSSNKFAATRCQRKTKSGKGPRCRRLAMVGSKWCISHQPNRRYWARMKREREMAEAVMDLEVFASKLEKAKRIREESRVELMEGSQVGVRVLTELAADEEAPKHVRVKASELLIRFSGASLEKVQVEHQGTVEHRHTVEEARQHVHAQLDRYAQDGEVVEAEVVEES